MLQKKSLYDLQLLDWDAAANQKSLEETTEEVLH